MEPGLKEHFKLYETFDIMEELRTEFADELIRIRYGYWDKFVSTKMKENTCPKTHLTRMYDTYELLTEMWNEWMDVIPREFFPN